MEDIAWRTQHRTGKDAASKLTSQGLDVEFLPIDMTNLESIEQAADTIRSDYSDLTLIINNAGMPGRSPVHSAIPGRSICGALLR